jgi:hypothetical protein
MTPTMTPTNNLPAQLREFNRWRRCDEAMEQPHPARIGAMIDEAADRLEELELKNQIFRAAQKACEDCDAPRVDRIAELERQLAEVKADSDSWWDMAHSRKLQADKANRELAAERKLADRLASALADSAMWHAPPAYEAWKKAREP